MVRVLMLAGVFLLVLGGSWTPGADKIEMPSVKIDRDRRQIIVDGKIAPRKIDHPSYKEIYPIEVIACWAFPRGQKAHETVITFDVKPSAVHAGLVSLGLKPGKPAFGESKDPPAGPEVKIFLEFTDAGGQLKKLPIEKTLIDPKTNKNLPPLKWRFTGSVMSKPDPNKEETVYGADLTGTLISIFPVTEQTVFQTNLTMKEEKYVKLETDKKVLPKEGTAVKLIIEVPESK